MRKESDIQKVIIKFLKYKGFVRKIHTTGIYDPARKAFRKNYNKGVPDIYFMSKKHGVIWFEVKTSKGKLSKEQEEFKNECEKSNINYYVVRSIDETEEALNESERNE